MSVPFVPMGNGFNFHEAFADGRRQGADQYKDARNFFENRRQFDTQAAFQERQEENLKGYRDGTLANDSARVGLERGRLGIEQGRFKMDQENNPFQQRMWTAQTENYAANSYLTKQQGDQVAPLARAEIQYKDRSGRAAETTANSSLIHANVAQGRWGEELRGIEEQRRIRESLASILAGNNTYGSVQSRISGLGDIDRLTLLGQPEVKALGEDAASLIANYEFSSPAEALSAVTEIMSSRDWDYFTPNQRANFQELKEIAEFATFANSGSTIAQGRNIPRGANQLSGLATFGTNASQRGNRRLRLINQMR
jgi:hypothetical protein